MVKTLLLAAPVGAIILVALAASVAALDRCTGPAVTARAIVGAEVIAASAAPVVIKIALRLLTVVLILKIVLTARST